MASSSPAHFLPLIMRVDQKQNISTSRIIYVAANYL